ncbi:hypothetical protein F5888DRAFT_1599149, partial [Russula emetica]
MLNVAKKYHTNLTAIKLSPRLQSQLPAWYHPHAEQRPLTTAAAKCLLEKHTTPTVTDLISTSARLRNQRHLLPHTPDSQCLCNDCSRDRTMGCRHPHFCAAEAQTRINLITPKYNPLGLEETQDNLSLTPARKNNNREAKRTNGVICFDPSITCKTELADCFRIFTDPDRISPIPARRNHTRGINHRHQETTIYTDGACINNGKMDACCGSGIWIGPNHAQNTAIQVPGPQQSNQVGEIATIMAAADIIPRFWPLTIASD